MANLFLSKLYENDFNDLSQIYFFTRLIKKILTFDFLIK